MEPSENHRSMDPSGHLERMLHLHNAATQLELLLNRTNKRDAESEQSSDEPQSSDTGKDYQRYRR